MENPGFLGWVADNRLVVRAALAPHPGRRLHLLVRDGAEEDWQPLVTIPAEDALTTSPVSFSRRRRLAARAELTGRGHRQAGQDQPGHGSAEVLAADPEADVTAVRLHPDTLEPQIATVLKDRSEYRVLDPSSPPISRPSGRCTREIPSSPAATTPTPPGLSASSTTRARPPTSPTTGRAGAAGSCSRHRPELSRLPARPDGAVLVHRPGRPDHPRLRHLPARGGPVRAADGAQRARRPVGARRLGLRPRGAVAGQPRLPLRAGQLPRLDRLRQGVRQCRATGSGAAGCRTT